MSNEFHDFQTKERRMHGLDEFDEKNWSFGLGETIMVTTFACGIVLLSYFWYVIS